MESHRNSEVIWLLRSLKPDVKMNPGAFMMRGLDNGRDASGLTALVNNLRRALNILSVETMMAAVPG